MLDAVAASRMALEFRIEHDIPAPLPQQVTIDKRDPVPDAERVPGA